MIFVAEWNPLARAILLANFWKKVFMAGNYLNICYLSSGQNVFFLVWDFWDFAPESSFFFGDFVHGFSLTFLSAKSTTNRRFSFLRVSQAFLRQNNQFNWTIWKQNRLTLFWKDFRKISFWRISVTSSNKGFTVEFKCGFNFHTSTLNLWPFMVKVFLINFCLFWF